MRAISLILIFLFCISNVPSVYPFEKDYLRVPMNQKEISGRMAEGVESLHRERIKRIIDSMRGAGPHIIDRSTRRYSWIEDLTALVNLLESQIDLEGLRQIEQALNEALPQRSRPITPESILSKQIRHILPIVRKAIKETEKRLSSQRRHATARIVDDSEKKQKRIARAVNSVANWLARQAKEGSIFFEESSTCVGGEYVDEPLTLTDFYDVRDKISNNNPNLGYWQIEVPQAATKEEIVQLLIQAAGLAPSEAAVLTVPDMQDRASRIINSVTSQRSEARGAGRYVLYRFMDMQNNSELLRGVNNKLKEQLKLLKATLRKEPHNFDILILIHSVNRTIQRIDKELRKRSQPVRTTRDIRSGV